MLKKVILPFITNNVEQLDYQHGFKTNHSTTTALHKISNIISKGLNRKNKPERTVLVALDMSEAFDTVNMHKFLGKIIITNIPNKIDKFLANYLKSRQA